MHTLKSQPYLSLITFVAYRNWRRLPIQVAARIDLDDMIGEILVRLASVSHKYDPKKASPATFIYRVATNHCHRVANHHLCQKRYNEAWTPWDRACDAAGVDAGIRFDEARAAIERLLMDASPTLKRELQRFLTTRRFRRLKPDVLEEWRQLVRKHHVSYSDMKLVLLGV